ncbi:hypothetical protein [Streptomyces sp. NPDC001604]|uniref:hypothetical protein n=1 Tax=Streptomyces sp. NPDC001604 TaxID=3364593 RepID=UPI0036B80D27
MPAAPVTVRGHQGMVVMMRFLRREGVFCRTCALASFRDMQADTMVMGWWGPLSVFITPFTLLANLGALSGIKRIPEPVAPGWRPPLHPGKPVFRRPAGILALIPLSLVGLVVAAIPVLLIIGLVVGPSHSTDSTDSTGSTDAYPTHDYPTLTVGSCARNDAAWPMDDLKPEPCDSAAAQYSVHPWTNPDCPAGEHSAGPMYSKNHDRPLCLRPLKR